MNKRQILSFIFLLFISASLFWWWSSHLPKPSKNPYESNPVGGIIGVYEISGEAIAKHAQVGIINRLVVGDRLEPSHSVRTFENSNIVLNILGSNDRLELGPDTEVSFTQTEGVLVIHLLRGELYAAFHGEKKDVIRQVQGSHLIITSDNADFLARFSESGLQRVDIFRGEAEVESGKKKQNLHKDQYASSSKLGEIKVLSHDLKVSTPLSHDRVYRESEQSEGRARFAWSGEPEGSKIELLIGSSPDSMTPVKLSDDSKSGETTYTFADGIYYWRLKATPPKSTKSLYGPMYKIFVESEKAVQLLEPFGSVSVKSKERLGGVLFRWSNPSRLERLLLEVSKSSDFSSTVIRQPLAENSAYTIVNINEIGPLYWRVNGFRHDSSELIASSVLPFEIVDQEFEINLIYPTDNMILTTKSLKLGTVQFMWKPVGITEYEVDISDSKSKSVLSQKLTGGVWSISYLAPGIYTFSIKVSGSQDIVRRRFAVVEAGSMKWKGVTEGTLKTLSQLQWEPYSDKDSVYRVQIYSYFPVLDAGSAVKEFISNKPTFAPDLAQDGVYIAIVQAIGPNSKVLAETSPLTFRFSGD